MKTLALFLKEVGLELRKVEWPSKKEFLSLFFATLVVVVAFSIFLGTCDAIIASAIKWILSRGA
jgi:preprotein translocase subunit SecE